MISIIKINYKMRVFSFGINIEIYYNLIFELSKHNKFDAKIIKVPQKNLRKDHQSTSNNGFNV